MQEINFIQFSQPDYPEISCSVTLSTPTFFLQNSKDSILLSGAAVHNQPGVGEKAGSEAESIQVRQYGREDLWQTVT